MKLDAKFYGDIRKVKDGSIVPEDEYVVFLAHDAAFLDTLVYYRAKCAEIGADQEHLDSLDRMIQRLIDWRQNNQEKIKVPDAKGDLLLG